MHLPDKSYLSDFLVGSLCNYFVQTPKLKVFLKDV